MLTAKKFKHNPSDKPFVIVDKVNERNKPFICHYPNSEPGKIKLDTRAHLRGCWIRKKLTTGRFTFDTSVTPNHFNDGYALGVALSS